MGFIAISCHYLDPVPGLPPSNEQLESALKWYLINYIDCGEADKNECSRYFGLDNENWIGV